MAKTFGAESTTDEVLEGVDLTGKRVLVTGVSAGLGVETVRTLVAHGVTVVATARDLAKAHRALAAAMGQKSSGVELVEMDLASLKSVRAAGRRFDSRVCPRVPRPRCGARSSRQPTRLAHIIAKTATSRW